MEEGKAEEHLLPFLGFVTLLETCCTDCTEGSQEVVLESTRRLVGHLDAFHENGDGEDVGRHRGKPNTEISVDIFRILQYPFEIRHERRSEMAILKQDPTSIIHRTFDSLFCQFSLPLTQRQDRKFGLEACFVSKVSDFDTWVSTRTEDEDEGSVAV